jgi:hypothetical protein
MKKHKFTVDISTDFRVWLDRKLPPWDRRPNGRSLAIQITADRDVNEKDKILFGAVMHSDSDRIDINSADRSRYFAFDFMLDPSYETPNVWAIHVQAFQCCSGHPPFTVQVTPSRAKRSDVEFTFNVTDDALENAKPGATRQIYKMRVLRGEWNRMALHLRPSPDDQAEPGIVEMWLNGLKRFSYTGYWGFRPKSGTTTALGLDLGIYRRRQATTQTIYFSDIKYGRDLASVDRPHH